MEVRSTVIDRIASKLEIVDTAGVKHIVPLEQGIRVTMVGYPDRETTTMLARELGTYMSRGYIIEKIELEWSKP